MRRVIVVLAVITAPAALLAAEVADASAGSAADGSSRATPHLARVEPAVAPPARPTLVAAYGERPVAAVKVSQAHDAAVLLETPALRGRSSGSGVIASGRAVASAAMGRPSARAPPRYI